jgi:hypothetical protein
MPGPRWPTPKGHVLRDLPPTITVKDFFKNPEKAGFRISPDGNFFSYRAPLARTA